jgi:predicted acetylornithine/succinylornithine family transaminase
MTEATQIRHPHLLENYARAPLTIVRGEGVWLFDDRGERYLDFIAGIAVCALGHAHPAITAAIAEQAGRLVQCSNLFHHEPAGTLANELAARSGFERVFFCNSGAEANEAAIKLARKLAFRRGELERRTILSCEGGFHGRTLGALAATPNPAYHAGFEPLPGGFEHVPFNDIAALERALDERIAAFIVEPVQGESGIVPADPAYLEAARRLCDERGALLVFDEIQCGMGRLGHLFAFEAYGVRPDLVTLAKALANGLPIGAVLIDARCASGLQPGDHGTTFGGSPVPCAAALAHLRVRDSFDARSTGLSAGGDGRGLDRHVEHVGAVLLDGLRELALRFPEIAGEPRGRGLMLGLPIREPFQAREISAAAREREHLLVNAAGRNTLRFVPPLILSVDEARDGLARLGRILEAEERVPAGQGA